MRLNDPHNNSNRGFMIRQGKVWLPMNRSWAPIRDHPYRSWDYSADIWFNHDQSRVNSFMIKIGYATVTPLPA